MNVDITNAKGSHVTMQGNLFAYDSITPENNVALTNATLKISTGEMAAKSWISNYEVAADAVLTTSATVTNNGTWTFQEGAKLVVSSLAALESCYTESEFNYEISGIQNVNVGKIVYSDSVTATGLTQVYIGSVTGETAEITDGQFVASENAYVVGANTTVTAGGTAQTEGLGNTAFGVFAVAETGTLQIAGDLTFADGQGSKTAANILSEAVGSGTLDVQCAAGSISNLNSDFTGKLKISNGGSLTMTGATSLNVTITGEGSTLEAGGCSLAGANITMGAGALLKKSTSHNWANVNQIKTLTLEGNATVDANYRMGVISTNANDKATLALGTNTLTVKASDANDKSGFILNNVDITGTGTIQIDSSALHIGYDGGATTISGTGTTIDLADTAGSIDKLQIEDSNSKLQIAALKGGSDSSILNAGTIELHGSSSYSLGATVKGGGSLKVTGTGTHTYTGSSIANAINVEHASGTFKFASDAAQTVSGAIAGTGKLSKSGAGTVTASGDASGFSGTMEVAGGTMSFTKADGAVDVSKGLTLNGGTLNVTGSLTLSSDTVTISNLESYFNMATDLSVDLITAGSITGWTGEASVGTYTSDGTEYTTSVSQKDNKLVLTFAAPADEVPTSFTVDSASLTGTVLTLNIDADLTDVSSVDLKLSEAALADIKDMTGLVDLSLVFANGTYTSVAGQDNSLTVSFYDGAYKGEANGQYNVAYIPEPTTATLSLLALMGLAARRRRK